MRPKKEWMIKKEDPDSISETGIHKIQTYKPGPVILPPSERTLAICLIDLPFLTLRRSGTSSPKFRIYMVFQPARFTLLICHHIGT